MLVEMVAAPIGTSPGRRLSYDRKAAIIGSPSSKRIDDSQRDSQPEEVDDSQFNRRTSMGTPSVIDTESFSMQSVESWGKPPVIKRPLPKSRPHRSGGDDDIDAEDSAVQFKIREFGFRSVGNPRFENSLLKRLKESIKPEDTNARENQILNRHPDAVVVTPPGGEPIRLMDFLAADPRSDHAAGGDVSEVDEAPSRLRILRGSPGLLLRGSPLRGSPGGSNRGSPAVALRVSPGGSYGSSPGGAQIHPHEMQKSSNNSRFSAVLESSNNPKFSGKLDLSNMPEIGVEAKSKVPDSDVESAGWKSSLPSETESDRDESALEQKWTTGHLETSNPRSWSPSIKAGEKESMGWDHRTNPQIVDKAKNITKADPRSASFSMFSRSLMDNFNFANPTGGHAKTPVGNYASPSSYGKTLKKNDGQSASFHGVLSRSLRLPDIKTRVLSSFRITTGKEDYLQSQYGDDDQSQYFDAENFEPLQRRNQQYWQPRRRKARQWKLPWKKLRWRWAKFAKKSAEYARRSVADCTSVGTHSHVKD